MVVVMLMGELGGENLMALERRLMMMCLVREASMMAISSPACV